MQRILDAMTGAAAFVRSGRMDLLAGSRLGYALYSEMFVDPARPANTARFVRRWTATLDQPEPADVTHP